MRSRDRNRDSKAAPMKHPEFRWHLLSECTDEGLCPIHGLNRVADDDPKSEDWPMHDDDLIAFQSARLDEYETAARAFAVPEWMIYENGECDFFVAPVQTETLGEAIADTWREDAASWIARHDPAHALREVAADRRILAMYAAFQQQAAAQGEAGEMIGLGTWAATRMVHEIIKIRASAWSDHPDHRPEWKP